MARAVQGAFVAMAPSKQEHSSLGGRVERSAPINLGLPLLPEVSQVVASGLLEPVDRLTLNQLRGVGCLHLLDLIESSIGVAARQRASSSVDAREALAPLLRFDTFDHGRLLQSFQQAFARARGIEPLRITGATELDRALAVGSPLAILVLALHFKLLAQQHYLDCVRAGGEVLEPAFVRIVKEHWMVERGEAGSAVLALQQALARALPGRVPAAMRDYRLLVFAADDVVTRQAELDAATLEAVRREPFAVDRNAVVAAQRLAYRRTLLTVGMVNAAFVYAIRGLGPSAPELLAGIVSALSRRG